MQIILSKQTAKALNKSMGFTLAALTKAPEHKKLSHESMRILGLTLQDVYSLIKLLDQINKKLLKNGKKHTKKG
jgi:hypothetical protein